VPGFGLASFGHNDAGGRLGIADPDADVSFGYACNSIHSIGRRRPTLGPLLAAVQRCI